MVAIKFKYGKGSPNTSKIPCYPSDSPERSNNTWDSTVDYENCSDETLLTLIIQRQPAAFEALYDRHAQTIYNLIVRIVRHQQIAEELLQETFWQVWKKADTFQAGGAAAAWLYRIARNKSLDKLRQQRVRPQPTLNAEPDTVWETLADHTNVEQLAEQRVISREIRTALARIPTEQRQCLELAYFEGMSHREIAEYTETPVGTIKTRLRGGLKKLETVLRTIGYTNEP